MSDNFMNNANATSIMTAVGNKIKTRDKTFYGTEAQWAALSTAQKKEYDFKATPDGGSKSSMIFADVPVGTILSYGGVSISKEWMLCQGQELLKADYPELYSVIADRFGTASDSSHFKLPDLRGEFLRGSGTNSHAGQGSGGNVGAHQDATAFPPLSSSKSNHKAGIFSNSGGDLNIYNQDSTIVKYSEGTRSWQMATASDQSTGLTYDLLTVRPTNTSVNFIIKVKNSVDIITDINNYSTEEKVIGVWTDGKPLYQKTIHLASLVIEPNNTAKYYQIQDILIDNLISSIGSFLFPINQSAIRYMFGFDYFNESLTTRIVRSDAFVQNSDHHARFRFYQAFSNNAVTITDIDVTLKYTKTTD